MRPMMFGLASVVTNIALGVSLFLWLKSRGLPGFPGLAVATSASSWLNVALLAGVLVRRGHWRMGGEGFRRLVRVGAATVVMGLVVGLIAVNRASVQGLLWDLKEAALAVAILAGGVTYAVAAFALKAVTVADVRSALRKPPNGAGSISSD
jgi:putative peptidoglycan lipid II flippase